MVAPQAYQPKTLWKRGATTPQPARCIRRGTLSSSSAALKNCSVNVEDVVVFAIRKRRILQQIGMPRFRIIEHAKNGMSIIELRVVAVADPRCNRNWERNDEVCKRMDRCVHEPPSVAASSKPVSNDAPAFPSSYVCAQHEMSKAAHHHSQVSPDALDRRACKFSQRFG